MEPHLTESHPHPNPPPDGDGDGDRYGATLGGPSQRSKKTLHRIPLDEFQEAAAKASFDVPLMIFASAGSGKTRVLCARVQEVVDGGVLPQHVLVVTFTVKAAREVQRRIGRPGVTVSTFHSFAFSILRRHYPAWKSLRQEQMRLVEKHSKKEDSSLNLSLSMESVSSDEDGIVVLPRKIQQSIAEDILYSLRTKKKSDRHDTPFASHAPDVPREVTREEIEELVRWIHSLKAKGKKFTDFDEDSEEWFTLKMYQERLLSMNFIDFADMVADAVDLLKNDATILSEMRTRYQHVLVDEFQDTSPVQFALIELLTNGDERSHITVVGDDDQSIYGFRGANSKIFDSFSKVFPNCDKKYLKYNYRSIPHIVHASKSVVEKNLYRESKDIIPEPKKSASSLTSESSKSIQILFSDNHTKECEDIAEMIHTMVETDKIAPKSIAVLCRVRKAILKDFEIALKKRGVPVSSWKNVQNQPDVFAVVSYMRLVHNENDSESCRSCLNAPRRGLGPTAFEYLGHYSRKYRLSLFRSCLEIATSVKPLETFAIRSRNVKPPNRKRREIILDFVKLIHRLKKEFKDSVDLAQKIVQWTNFEEYAEKEIVSREAGMAMSGKDIDQDDQMNFRDDFLKLQNILKELSTELDLEEAFLDEEEVCGEDGEDGGKEGAHVKEEKMIRLERVLNELSLRDLDAECACNGDGGENDGSRKGEVMVTTIHQAKGMEWDHVFVVRMNEGTLPLNPCQTSILSAHQVDHLEEERRLAYVAISRARISVCLSALRHPTEQYSSRPSRFMFDIPDSLVKLPPDFKRNDRSFVMDRKNPLMDPSCMLAAPSAASSLKTPAPMQHASRTVLSAHMMPSSAASTSFRKTSGSLIKLDKREGKERKEMKEETLTVGSSMDMSDFYDQDIPFLPAPRPKDHGLDGKEKEVLTSHPRPPRAEAAQKPLLQSRHHMVEKNERNKQDSFRTPDPLPMMCIDHLAQTRGKDTFPTSPSTSTSTQLLGNKRTGDGDYEALFEDVEEILTSFSSKKKTKR